MNFAVLIVSPPGYTHSECFREVAETIHHGLLTLGHQSCVTTGLMPGARHIVLGSNLLLNYPLQLPGDSILYNLEQVRDNELWTNSNFFALLRQFTVWDYAKENADEFKAHGVPVSAILPISYFDGLSKIEPAKQQDIDVLFIGSLNERRKIILEQLQAYGLKTIWLFNEYGAKRDAHIARAKVLLNMHYHKAKILEQVRISYYLANGACVLSENSSNPTIDAEWSEGVLFSPYELLADNALKLCHDVDARHQLGLRGLEFMKKKSLVPALEKALALP